MRGFSAITAVMEIRKEHLALSRESQAFNPVTGITIRNPNLEIQNKFEFQNDGMTETTTSKNGE